MTDTTVISELQAGMTEAAERAVEALAPTGTAVDLVRSLAARDTFIRSAGGHTPSDDWKYRSQIELILAEGEAFDAGQVRYVDGIDGTPKNCFEDALMLAMEHSDEGWSYAEGYAVGAAGLDVHHAWVVDDEGRVVDPTWQAVAATHHGVFPHPHAAYVGVVFNLEVVLAWVAEKGTYGVFDWMHIEPLMEHGLDAMPNPLLGWDGD